MDEQHQLFVTEEAEKFSERAQNLTGRASKKSYILKCLSDASTISIIFISLSISVLSLYDTDRALAIAILSTVAPAVETFRKIFRFHERSIELKIVSLEAMKLDSTAKELVISGFEYDELKEFFSDLTDSLKDLEMQEFSPGRRI